MDKKALLEVLRKAKKYTVSPKKRMTVEILKTFHIRIVDGWMHISSTDLEKQFTCSLPTDCKNMEIFPYAKLFVDIINSLDNGEFSMEYSRIYRHKKPENHDGITKLVSFEEQLPCLIIKQNRTIFKIFTNGGNAYQNNPFSAEQFPKLANINDEGNIIKKKITIGKTGITATISHVEYPKTDTDYDATNGLVDKDINKLFPKYLKIHGLVAKKGKLQTEYMFDKGKHMYKYYCSYFNEQEETRVFTDEIENYETIN